MKATRIVDILNGDPGTEVLAQGWIRTRRDSKGGFSFIALNDGSCFSNLQIVADQKLSNYETEIKHLHPGASIEVHGTLSESPGKGQNVELHAKSLKVLGHCTPSEYPLEKQRVSFERLRELQHLRSRTNTFGAMTRVRHTLSQATHQFFSNRGFYYLHTPIITSSDCEGAGQMFRVSTLDPKSPAKTDEGQVDFHQDFFGRETHLTVSGQLEAETYACALGKVYTFGPTFRAENSNTPRHLAEFWMVEPEMAFADLNEDASVAEAYLKFCFQSVLDQCSEDLDFFNLRVEPGLLEHLQSLAQQSFERMSYTEAIERLRASDEKFEYVPEWGCDLQTEHERYLTEKVTESPLIITDYPKDIKAFYMRLNDDEKTVAAMDVLLPRIGEIIGGSQREERHDYLEKRIVEMNHDPKDYQWYLDLRKFGTVPHAGFGLGFERLVQICTGLQNIRDCIPFPRTPKHAGF